MWMFPLPGLHSTTTKCFYQCASTKPFDSSAFFFALHIPLHPNTSFLRRLPTKIEVGEVVVPLELETRGTKMLITFHRNNMPFEGEHLAAETYHIDGDSERLFPMHRFDQPGQYQISINCDTNGPIDKFALAGSSSKVLRRSLTVVPCMSNSPS
jgi:hypothetical protein